jgi:hypothetical protein
VVVLDVLDAVREYTFISVEIKSVSETFISWSFTSFVFHNTDTTFYLHSPFPLTLCVLINKKGFDTMRFRHTGKSPRRNLKTKWVGGPICMRFSWRRIDWWAPEARFF